MSFNTIGTYIEPVIEKLKFVYGKIDVLKKKIHAITEKNPDYIDFKKINEVPND